MNDRKDGGPAFPCACVVCFDGMSLRDYFAAQAVTLFPMNAGDVGMLLNDRKHRPAHEIVAKFCYGLADALLAARAKAKEAQ